MTRFLACLLLLASCSSAWAQGVDAMSSILLVSKKDMRDPFFRDSVVLVTHRVGPAPVGVILNRATGIVVNTALPEAARRSKEEVVFFGGPVDVEGLLVIFRAKDPPGDAVEVLDGVYMTMRRETINALLARNPPIQDLRVYAGYAGWAPGQLETEVARGDWHLVRADAATIFEKRPDVLWRDLEHKAAGKLTSAAVARGTSSPLHP